MRLAFALRSGFAAVAFASLTLAAPASAETAKTSAYATGHVYLIRGFANFWSRGMDKFKVELDALGVPNTILNHRIWHDLADKIIAENKAGKRVQPIIVIGHSYGADAGVVLSNLLGENGIPVRLLVTFDGRNKIPPVGDTVGEVIDYYKPPFGRAVTVVAGFSGPFTVTNLAGRKDITHDNIDKKDEYHKLVLARVLEILKSKAKAVKS